MSKYIEISVSTTPFHGREEGKRYPSKERFFSLSEILAITTAQGGKGAYIYTFSDPEPLITTQEYSFTKIKEILLSMKNGQLVYQENSLFMLPIGKTKLINYGKITSIKADQGCVRFSGGKELPLTPEELEEIAKYLKSIEQHANNIHHQQNKIIQTFIKALEEQSTNVGCVQFLIFLFLFINTILLIIVLIRL